MKTPSGVPSTWVLDLDGVVWLGDEPVPGSVEAVARLRRRGDGVLFVTNNSSMRLADYRAKLERMGVSVAATELCTSAQAAAQLLSPGARAVVCAGPGVEEALTERGARVVPEGPSDAVVVGWHRSFDYDRLTVAFRAVHGGARLIGTNDDATYPTPDGPIPGGGSILAAVATAAGVHPEIAGKPYEPMAALVRRRLGEGGRAAAFVVGDRPSTDGLLARRLDAPFALVLSGVTAAADLSVDPVPDEVAADLATLVERQAQDST